MSGETNAGHPDLAPYTPTNEEKAQALQLAQLLDQGSGFGAEKMRTIFPKQGWNVIHAILDGLVDSGQLTKSQVRLTGSKVSTWVYRKVN
jgi:hypothetical protein